MHNWADVPDERLLDVRLCDLGIRIQGSFLEPCIDQLYRELEERGVAVRPHFWLSREWFTPDRVTGSALAFYAAHPRLMELERAQMLEVEGGTRDWCMRILRHEAGHVVDNAYRLRRKKRRQKLFGRSSRPYPERYSPKPYSKSYVRHLDYGYAQSHPDEDFAETFAVWLTPASDWQTRYSIWPVWQKLEYMDKLMREVSGKAPLLWNSHTVEPIEAAQETLREHYRAKRELHQVDFPKTYDRDLRSIFTNAPRNHHGRPAAGFLDGIRREVRRRVARTTGIYQYTIDQVIDAMVERCNELDLRLEDPPEIVAAEFENLLTTHSREYLESGRYRFAL